MGMATAFKQRVTVDADGSIRVRLPNLQPGSSAEVIVLLEEHAANGDEVTWSQFMGSGPGRFKST